MFTNSSVPGTELRHFKRVGESLFTAFDVIDTKFEGGALRVQKGFGVLRASYLPTRESVCFAL
jgi:hypothetical protein